MRMTRWFIGCVVAVLLLATAVQAAEVRIFKPREEDISPMQLRAQAMAEGFAQAVLDQAVTMLPAGLDESRTEALRQYFVGHSKPYIQGYKIISSQDMEAGLILRLDVRVNRKVLRGGLIKLGLFQTTEQPLAASVVWPEDLDEDASALVGSLVTMSGLALEEGAVPSFTLELGPKNSYKGHLILEDSEWKATNKDMSALWVELWARYFTKVEDSLEKEKPLELSISGWFAPDAALEFDRVLRGWESVVQEARLVEMDMQPTGVGAIWEIRTLGEERLKNMLQAYLPERGLSFVLVKGADE